jgi:hypothetical protein
LRAGKVHPRVAIAASSCFRDGSGVAVACVRDGVRLAAWILDSGRLAHRAGGVFIMSIRHNRQRTGQLGSAVTEHAFVLVGILGLVLAVARVGLETGSMFDQLSHVFSRTSASRGKQPNGRRARPHSNPTAMAPAGAAAPASPTAAPKKASSKRSQGSGGGRVAKRKATPGKRGGEVSWGVGTASAGGSGLLSRLIGG